MRNVGFKQAVFWYQQAAEQGNGVAQHNLASMYFLGQGVDRDKNNNIIVYKWANLACSNGLEGSGHLREMIAKKMNILELEQAQALAREIWLRTQ
jgi:TPR repeat protein